MHTLYVFSVWLHVMAAMLWIGGALFLVVVLVPVLKSTNLGAAAQVIIRATGTRFRYVGWACLLTLLATGVINLWCRGFLSSPELWEGPYGRVLGIKLTLVAIIVILSVIHDFYLGPAASKAGRLDPSGARTEVLRKRAAWMGRVTVLLAVFVILCGVMLVRGVLW